MIHLRHIFTKQRIHSARVDGFCSMPPFMCRHFLFMPLPCWSRLHGSPPSSIEEFAFPIWCASTAQYTRILPHRSKASEEFIKRNYSKIRKSRRGSRYKRCSTEQIRWLSNIGRKDKQRQRGHNQREIEREYSEFKRGLGITCLILFVECINWMLNG